MGITERKEREKLEMKELILGAAMELFIDEGYDKASIRKIADRIEYSPATIYLYYKDKDEIFHAIHEKGFEIFFRQMDATAVIQNPFERLRKLGEIYLKFAYDHPELYDLMFIMRAPVDFMRDETWDCGHRAHEGLKQIVKECIEAGDMKQMDVEVASLSIWSFVHGIASLDIRNRFKMYTREQLNAMIPEAIENMLSLFRKT